MDGLEIARTIVEALEDKKGEDILLLDLKDLAAITDYFVICTGTSSRMLKALVHSALDAVREKYALKTKVEGTEVDGWILADYGNVVLHVFSEAQREYYGLEQFWSEGKVILHLQ